MTESGKEKKYDCTDCPYPRYKDSRVIFCDVCIRKIKVAEGKVQHHVVISGVLILLQDGSDFALNGFQTVHKFLRSVHFSAQQSL